MADSMKKRLIFVWIMTCIVVLTGCGKSETQNNVQETANSATNSTDSTTSTTSTTSRQDTDFGPYQGQEYTINQTLNLYDFTVTLNKIVIGNQNFGKYEDGYASLIITGYVSQRIIGDLTIQAKRPANLSTLQIGIGRNNNGWGTSYNSAVYEWKMTTWAVKFGFFQDGLDVPMSGWETKNIKVIIPLLDQFAGNWPYHFHLADYKYVMDTEDKRKEVKFDLGQYLKY
jgi:hypothetical protein